MKSRLAARWNADERVRFLVIGGWNTLFGYAVFVALYAAAHRALHYLVIALLAHAIAMVNAFAAHRRLVFRARGPWARQFLRFNVAQLSVLGGSLGALWLLVHLTGLDPVLAQALVAVCAVAASYVAHRRFSFPAAGDERPHA